jgi:hypothetical protein
MVGGFQLHREDTPFSFSTTIGTRPYRERVVSLFRQHGARSTRTGVDGAYVFNDVPSGPVLVFAQWNTKELIGSSWFDVPHVWLLPIDVKRGVNKLDLSGSNAGGAFWRR